MDEYTQMYVCVYISSKMTYIMFFSVPLLFIHVLP